MSLPWSGADQKPAIINGVEMVPRQLLDDATAGVERLKQKLDEANAENRREMEAALKSMQWQLRTLQGQCRASDDQLQRSLERERDLRAQLTDQDVNNVMRKLAEENTGLHADNSYLREQVEILTQDARVHAEVKRELSHLREHMDRVGSVHQNALSSASEQKERLASEASEALSALRSEFEMRAQTHEEEMALATTRSKQLEGRITLLEQDLEEARNHAKTAEEAVRACSAHNVLLENDVAGSQRLITQKEAAVHEQLIRVSKLQEELQAVEKARLDDREQLAQLNAELSQKQEQVNSLQESVQAVETREKNERETMSMNIEELQHKIAMFSSDVQSAQNDVANTREQMRQDLRQVEADNDRLRSSLREEREKLDRAEQEHRQALADLHEQRRGLESDLTERELQMQKQLKALQKEMQETISTTVPEAEFVQFKEDAFREKQELTRQLQESHDESKKLSESASSQKKSLEAKAKDLENLLEHKEDRLKILAKDLKLSEEQALREKKARENLQQQMNALIGNQPSDPTTEGIKVTKMAETAIRILDKKFADCHTELSKWCKNDTDGSTMERTALGMCLNGTRVEAVLPGSPAHVCDMIEPSDELLMVDGHKVTEHTAMAAIRGNESSTAVVALLLRKAGRDEMVKVYLPRTPLDLLQRRQEVNEVLEELQEKANQVGGEGSELQAMDILKQVVDSVRLLDDVNLEAQVRWCGQVSALVGGLETVLAHAKKSVLDVDAAHQQVHVLQSLTETELRQFSSQESLGSREELLHKQIQELEDDLKSLQEELKSSQMLHRESLEDNNHLQERFQGLEDELKESQVSMNSLKRAVLRAEGALEEVQSELSQLPYTLRAILDMGYEDAVGTTPETKAVMDMHLQEDISIALKIPKTQVEVLCYTRGIGTMAEVKISPSTNLPVYGHKDPFSCKELAEELQRQVADPKSGIHTGQAGKNIKEIEVHGPIADQTARAFRSTLIDMDGNHARTREELARLQDKLREVNMKHHAAIKEEESIKQQIIQDCESRMAAATTDFRSKLSRATDDLAKQAQKEQEDVLEKQKMEFRAAMEDLRLDSSNRAAMLEDANEKLESELQSVRGKLYALESQDSSSRAERESTEDKLRIIEKANAKTKAVYQQVDDILVPELKGCLTTLRNIESEMDFFHTHSMRALALAQHANGHSLPSSQDAHRSKDCIEKDMSVLRLQLEILSQFTYNEPEVFLQELRNAVYLAESPLDKKHEHMSTDRILVSPAVINQ